MTLPRSARTWSRPARSHLLVAGVLAALFVVLACVVLTRHGTPYGFDTGPHRWSVAHRPHAMASAARALTAAGTGPYPYVAAAVGGWLGGGRTGRKAIVTALLAVVVLVTGQLVRTLLMVVLHRSRPPVADWAASATGHAFPSGHTASSAIAAGLLAWGLLRTLPPLAGRIAAGACVVVAVAVGCTRVYLGVHWPTDVVGGWLFAGCWLAVGLPLLASYPRGGGQAGDPSGAQDGAPAGGRDERAADGRGQTETP